MADLEFTLALALDAEHKARTGHDSASMAALRSMCCDVCMNLRHYWRERERMENEAMEAAARLAQEARDA